MINHQKILSLLNLTMSDNDNEALAAIRAANRILQKEKIEWHKFYHVPYRPEAEPPPPKAKKKHEKPKDETMEMIEFIRENAWPKFDFTFIDSLEESFNKYGRLTPKQFAALEKIYNKIKD